MEINSNFNDEELQMIKAMKDENGNIRTASEISQATNVSIISVIVFLSGLSQRIHLMSDEQVKRDSGLTKEEIKNVIWNMTNKIDKDHGER